jgi:hypothetical protein
MTKQHLIEAIIDFLASDAAGEAKGVYHSEIVKTHLFNAFNRLIYDTYVAGKKAGEFSQIDAWSRTYEVTVQNQCGKRAYCFLPFAPVQLPDGMGVRFIRSHWECPPYGAGIGTEWMFAPIEATANAIFDELEVSDMDDMPTYRLEQSNLNVGAGEKSHMLWLENLPEAPDLISSIDILMVQNLQQMDDYDEIIIPLGGEEILTKGVIELMVRKPMPDVSNDMVNKPPTQ